MKKDNICCWDLEGPISNLDFAAEIGKLLSKKPELGLQKFDMGEFFTMISNYDDYLIEIPGIKEALGIPEYQPGDTLRIMAPLYVSSFSDDELTKLAKNNLGLLPGSKELMKKLHKNWDVYVISTSYTQFAHNVTKALKIPQDHVYCTNFNIKELKKGLINIEKSVDILVKDIFVKYLKNEKNLDSVINELNEFFWKSNDNDYKTIMNKVEVRGGLRKELAIEDINKRTGIEISEMIAIGDSITDINMLQRVNKEGGIAISFNGNRFSAKRANVAVTTPNNLGVLPVFESKNNISEFLDKWETKFTDFKDNLDNINSKLVSDQTRSYFIKFNFIPEIYNLKNKTEEEINKIISEQEKMRKKVRGWAGNLG